jgi:DNA modification methylase
MIKSTDLHGFETVFAREMLVTSHRKEPKVQTRGLTNQIVWRNLQELKPFPNNPRRHPEAQIARLMKSMGRVWTNPILIDETGTILAGHGRCEAARRLDLKLVPTITIVGLTAEEKRAVVIADNRLPEQAIWDVDLLRHHFKGLLELDFNVELTGFSTGEVDLIDCGAQDPMADRDDNFHGAPARGPAITRQGDVWSLGRHRLACGDAQHSEDCATLLEDKLAAMIIADPPYNVVINGNAAGHGKIRHREFAMASGEMKPKEYTAFLKHICQNAIKFSRNGSIHYIFMDWRHLPELLAAAQPLYTEWKNLLVWNKNNAGQGSFYRSKHELIAVFKTGTAPHVNNFRLGAGGRYRANVLDYPSVNSLSKARRGDLELHPTTKPVALIADLIRDCSRRNDIILDPFGGSGTTIMAAERTGRVARVIELDPLYVDVAIRRWQETTGTPARHSETGQTFSELEATRTAVSTDSNEEAGDE